MLVSLKANNCMIYNTEVEFSMRANMHYKKFSTNLISVNNTNILKTAILIGPNNSGKTNFIRIIRLVKDIMLNKKPQIKSNLFTNNPMCELAVSFLEEEKEFVFEIKYNVQKGEYVFERFAQINRDQYKNVSEKDILIRDSITSTYYCEDTTLTEVMKVAAKNNILIYLMDTEHFSILKYISDIITSFASKIDIIDMNNIPIKKTIDILKSSDSKKKKIVDFILNADLSLEDYRYLNDDELKLSISKSISNDEMPQENAISISESFVEMLHLTSIYKGIPVPSILFDSTGTKKMAALASYVVDALESGRILFIDELDNSLHFRLTRAIISLFNNQLNQKAQLIATVHDVSLLDCQTLFRKEQIWFTHKDTDNAYLYSLAEFTAEKDGIRDTSDVVEKYKKGIFGALPDPDLFKTLLEVTADE